jgi:nicotinamide mononucleotide adenylyltransferase
MNGRSVVIYPGRFQPLHKDHLGVIKVILRNLSDRRLVIAVADWQGERNRPNFLTGEEATALVALGLADWHLDGQVDVQMITLSPERGLRGIIKNTWPSLADALIFSGSNLTKRVAKEAGLKVFPLNESELDLHAQDVRDSIIAGDDQWKNWLTESEIGYIMNHNLDRRLRNLPEGPKRPWGIETDTACPPSGRERV